MTRPLLFSALAAAVVLTAAAGQDKPAVKKDDPIAAELTRAKDEFLATHEKAKERLLAKFAEEEKRLTDSTALKIDDRVKRLKQIQDEKKAFEDLGKLPKAGALKVAVSDYQTKVNAAKQKCETAFDVAAEKYRKKEKDLAATRAVLAEKENFFRGLTDTRTLWAGGRKKFILTDKGEWQETNEQGQTFRYKETDRTKDYVEMRDAVRGRRSSAPSSRSRPSPITTTPCRSPTTPSTVSVPACGAATATPPTVPAATSRPAVCGRTATTSTRRTPRSADTSSPASAVRTTR